MDKWYLFWILTLQNNVGEIRELSMMQVPFDTQTECMIELEAKKNELESLIGGKWYLTHYYGGRVRLSGTLVGVSVGCKNGKL